MVCLEVAGVLHIEKPGPNNDAIAVIDCNKGNSNCVSNWKILGLLLLLVVGSISMVFSFLSFFISNLCVFVCNLTYQC